ncbi:MULTISPECIES: hemin-degrading factor [unclassified Pantoea]|uniref:hemin-degrading factor n=1 Tax=unclassified Pantoea TaxID=2630326 RepID=UPI001CD36D5E|nr:MULTISPECIES: ChuX/HutX family heme-like substrate-binding protein [unclassified Pantoea]MCA1178261.1 hemin-degrading factor [Pantoea sp. alder69]MCA1251887.1 hemin-degrading factor [Pantoea sp. alder70]MCA1266643.1 hemin-degrading factor [Pantoea sp. alder81]
MNPRYDHYLALKGEHPKKYARDLAALMGIGEAQLCEARVGQDAQALKADFPALLKALEAVGETKSITRNEYAVHEQVGKYENLHLGEHAGLILNPRALDQRLFPAQWHSAFFLREQTARGERQSIQIFDRHADAVLKIYTTDNTDMAAWDALIAEFTIEAAAALDPQPAAAPEHSRTIDASKVEAEWRAITDVHQFFGLLKRHNISRQQAFHAVPDDLARQVSNDSLAQLLEQTQQDGNEIMIFIGNRGCTQIFTGAVEKLMPMDNWVNIFNPTFTLHLMADHIAESWVTRKPSGDGFVTSLELFAADGTQIAQLYGQRSEGTPEQARWREQVTALGATA